MAAPKRIGILTSGGDCAGLNAVIRAVVYAATGRGWEVIGIEDGTAGLLDRPMRYRNLTRQMFDTTVMRLGGTILGTTNKGNPFRLPQADGSFKDGSDDIIAGIKDLGIEALIGIGGDGSMEILQTLAKRGGFNLICIPKTMDNDVGRTEVSVGFETAAYVATEALDRLQPTAASHDRVMVLEVMGRDAGHVALNAGIAGGADVILLPEIPYDIEKVAVKIRTCVAENRGFALVIVSEAVKTSSGDALKVEHSGGEKRYGGIGNYLGAQISERTGFETRVTVLGHVLRGAPPIHTDRLVAAAFGVHAVELIAEGKYNRMVAWSNRRVIDVAIDEAIASYQIVDLDGALVKTARALGICLGD
jgi:6-phosphofructokinase 1